MEKFVSRKARKFFEQGEYLALPAHVSKKELFFQLTKVKSQCLTILNRIL